jgi:hypothetical protein
MVQAFLEASAEPAAKQARGPAAALAAQAEPASTADTVAGVDLAASQIEATPLAAASLEL